MSSTPNDFNIDRQVCTLNKPEKYSRPRQFKMSNKLTTMITPLIWRTRRNQRIWNLSYESMHRTFHNRKEALAEKLGNLNLLNLTFKTFRHWKATFEYHRTKDILYVKQLLGHKNINNTLVYTHLVEFEGEDSYIVKVASTLEEFTELLEKGFEYVSDYKGGMKILRKRK